MPEDSSGPSTLICPVGALGCRDHVDPEIMVSLRQGLVEKLQLVHGRHDGCIGAGEPALCE
jgi:hypothetical protein